MAWKRSPYTIEERKRLKALGSAIRYQKNKANGIVQKDDPVRRKKYNSENRLRQKAKFVQKKYGIPFDEYERLRQQATHCPICGVEFSDKHLAPNSKVLDHCHATGKVRGFICSSCNCGLGNFHDSIESLTKALQWVENHRG